LNRLRTRPGLYSPTPTRKLRTSEVLAWHIPISPKAPTQANMVRPTRSVSVRRPPRKQMWLPHAKVLPRLPHAAKLLQLLKPCTRPMREDTHKDDRPFGTAAPPRYASLPPYMRSKELLESIPAYDHRKFSTSLSSAIRIRSSGSSRRFRKSDSSSTIGPLDSRRGA